MTEKSIEIDFGVLGIGILQSPDGKISFDIQEVAECLGVPQNAQFSHIQKKISRLNDGEKLNFQHRLLERARALSRQGTRRGVR